MVRLFILSLSLSLSHSLSLPLSLSLSLSYTLILELYSVDKYLSYFKLPIQMQFVKDTNKTHELGSCITDMICA